MLCCLLPVSPSVASESGSPNLAAFSLKAGNLFTPNDHTHFTLLTYSSLRPYTLLLDEPAHEMLKTKYELSIGYADGDYSGTMVSANMIAHRYLTPPSKGARLYLEGGIGLIYTKFKIPGQGLHLNFNPLMGIGFDLGDARNRRYFVSLRISHISNGGFDRHNKWSDSLVLSIGRELN